VTLYSKVATLLEKLKNEHPDVIRVAISCGLSLPIKDFAELEGLLIKEKASFEVGILVLISVKHSSYSLLLIILSICVSLCRVLWTRPLTKMGDHPHLWMNFRI
jgi:hypothetical protein